MKFRKRPEILALCLGNALGFMTSGAIPLWVDAEIKGGSLMATWVGWLASGELFAMAVGVLCLSVWRAPPKRTAIIASIGAIAANLIATLTMPWTLALGRIASGLALGAVLSSVNRVAARRPDAQRVLSLMQAGMVVLVSVAFLAGPALIARFSVSGLFGLYAAISAFMVLAAFGLPDRVQGDAAYPAAQGQNRFALQAVVACIALGIAFLGHNDLWAYIVTIGKGLGIEAHALGTALALVPPLAMLGPIAAHRLGNRAGLLPPLIVALAIYIADAFVLIRAENVIVFCMTASVINIVMLFITPYSIALIGRLDPTGRFAGAAPAFMMIGGSIGPAVGSRLVGAGRFNPLALVASVSIAVSMTLFALARSKAPTQDLRPREH